LALPAGDAAAAPTAIFVPILLGKSPPDERLQLRLRLTLIGGASIHGLNVATTSSTRRALR
jgi:hypothetical protein